MRCLLSGSVGVAAVVAAVAAAVAGDQSSNRLPMPVSQRWKPPGIFSWLLITGFLRRLSRPGSRRRFRRRC